MRLPQCQAHSHLSQYHLRHITTEVVPAVAHAAAATVKAAAEAMGADLDLVHGALAHAATNVVRDRVAAVLTRSLAHVPAAWSGDAGAEAPTTAHASTMETIVGDSHAAVAAVELVQASEISGIVIVIVTGIADSVGMLREGIAAVIDKGDDHAPTVARVLIAREAHAAPIDAAIANHRLHHRRYPTMDTMRA